MENFFAVFAVVKAGNGFAATTRAADRGEFGRIGLAGGKVDANETAVEAVIREAAEEGWFITGVNPTPIHTALYDGKMVGWFTATNAVKAITYKEMGRITPIEVTREAIIACGYGNENVPFPA